MAISLTVAGPRASSFKRLASSVIAASLRPPREDRVTVNSPGPIARRPADRAPCAMLVGC
jgi:hypothetical protein